MPTLPSPLEACKLDLLTPDEELRAKYPLHLAERVMRLREVYNLWMANPGMKDRELRDTIMSRFRVSQSTAYSDLTVVHQLAPLLSQKSRDFHLLRANEMLLETYAIAKERGDVRTMQQTASTYAKVNKVDEPEEAAVRFDELAPQPFCATTDVTVLGIKPIPDVANYIARLTRELSRDFADITDVEFEEADLEENFLFPTEAPAIDAPDQP